jgi:hypothetical protein
MNPFSGNPFDRIMNGIAQAQAADAQRKFGWIKEGNLIEMVKCPFCDGYYATIDKCGCTERNQVDKTI